MYHTVGVFNGEGPPVPIPNTAVKLTCADNTWLETAREDRKMPTYATVVPRGAAVFYSHFRAAIPDSGSPRIF